MTRSARSHLLRAGAILACGVLLGAIPVIVTLPRADYQAGALRQNLVHHFQARHQLAVAPESLILPGGEAVEASLWPREAFFLGRPAGSKQRDVYFAHFILSARAVPVHASPAFSLSRTEAADEAELCYDNRRYLAYASLVGGRSQVITILDLEGLSGRSLQGFSRGQRLLQRLTNWQDTGRFAGLDRVEVRLRLPRKVHLRWEGQTLVVRGRGGRHVASVDPLAARTVKGAAVTRRVKVGKRSFIAWAVDTVRNFSFVGPERIAWLEELVYGVVDRARRMSGAEVTASEIADEMDLPLVKGTKADRIEGWPPPPLRPMLPKPLDGEGKWVEVQGPFVRQAPGRPPYFAMTFLRPDKERLFARVYFVAWDPRRLDLRLRGGTREPRSATGNRGDGVIPRKPELARRLVAAFNGGFQSIHGDFGMGVAGKVYVPPKPWAATVARLADGSTAFGTWDGRSVYGWVPPWIHSYRQNLTPLVEDGKFNPWKRGSWGGGLGGSGGGGVKAHIIRSGICLHKSGHMMFVMGDPVDGPTLGRAMRAGGCDYGMELDINRGHVGFEFYNVLAPGEEPPAGADKFRKIKYFSYTGTFPGLRDHRYFMREVIRGSGNPAPRWTGREARDFFYLVQRRLLPGADLKPLGTAPNEGRWTEATLPRAALGFPQAMARTVLQPDPAVRVHLLKLDLRWLEATLCLPGPGRDCLMSGEGDADRAEPLAVLPLGRFGPGRAVTAGGGVRAGKRGAGRFVLLAPRRPGGPALAALANGPGGGVESLGIQAAPADNPGASPVRAALCPGPGGGLLYAAGLSATDAHLSAALKRAGCAGEPLSLGAVEPLVLRREGAYHSLFGSTLPAVASTPSLVLRRGKPAWGSRIFRHVKPQPRRVWTAVQPERTRGTNLRHANRVIEELGLEPIRDLRALCRPPYDEEPRLIKLRWRDPVTGKGLCKGDRGRKRKRKKRRKKTP